MSERRDRAHESAEGQELVPHSGMPRWVKAFLLAAAALVVLTVAVMLISGGDHGPGRHLSSATTRGAALPQVTG